MTDKYPVPGSQELIEAVLGFKDPLEVSSDELRTAKCLIIVMYDIAIQLAALRELIEKRGINVTNHY